MQVSSLLIERVMKERMPLSVYCSWLALERLSAVIGAARLSSYLTAMETSSWPCCAVHTHALLVVPMSKRLHPTLLQGWFCKLSSFSVGAALEKSPFRHF